MGDVLEGSAGGISRLPEPLINVIEKMHGKDRERKQHFQRLCGHLSKKTSFGYLIKGCKTEVRCLNVTRMGEVLLLPEAPQGS